ncbi:MAG: UDP-3-O-acyl-N-acetylglucosamine deacetylase [Acidobacteriota bacterium]
MRRQRTVGRPARFEGIGLHSGRRCRVSVEPAPAWHGVVFVRDDLGGRDVPALQQYRAPMVNATRLERDGAVVDTPEHLLAALYALGVDNVRVRLDGPELPILDGSSLPFARGLLEAGLVEQDEDCPRLVLTAPVSVGDEARRLEAHPFDGFRLTAAIDFEHRHLGHQQLTVRCDRQEDFLAKLAPARTFALREDVERLREMGLVRGGSLDSAIVVGEQGVEGAELRFPDEFVRHKLLDIVGDLALLGCPLRARVLAWRSGHALHGRLADALLAEPANWIFESPPGGPDRPPAQPAPPGRAGARAG